MLRLCFTYASLMLHLCFFWFFSFYMTVPSSSLVFCRISCFTYTSLMLDFYFSFLFDCSCIFSSFSTISCFTCASLMLHLCFTYTSLMLHLCFTYASLMLHLYFSRAPRLSYSWAATHGSLFVLPCLCSLRQNPYGMHECMFLSRSQLRLVLGGFVKNHGGRPLVLSGPTWSF